MRRRVLRQLKNILRSTMLSLFVVLFAGTPILPILPDLFVLHAAAPVVVINVPTQGAEIEQGTLSYDVDYGDADNSCSFEIDGGGEIFTTCGTGSHGITTDLEVGEHTLVVRGSAGSDQGSATVTFTVTPSTTPDVMGCMDPAADNYNPSATVDDASCTYGGGGGGGTVTIFVTVIDDQNNQPDGVLVEYACTPEDSYTELGSTNGGGLVGGVINCADEDPIRFRASGGGYDTIESTEPFVVDTNYSPNYFEFHNLHLTDGGGGGESPFAGGDGTGEDPFQIASCSMLGSVNDDLDAAYVVTDDLNCADDGASVMIGTGENPFVGSFDGGGYCITLNLNVDDAQVGLFAHTDGATIWRVHIAGSVTGSGDSVGALIGDAGSDTVVDDIANTADVRGRNNVGGIVGIGSNINISDAYNSGDISSSGEQNMGGILGFAAGSSTIERVYNIGAIGRSDEFRYYLGGILGWRDSAGTSVSNTFNAGPIRSTYPIIGAIVGADIPSSGSLAAGYSNNYFDITRSGISACAQDSFGNPVSADGQCQTVNNGGSDPYYFKGNDSNNPFPNWDFGDVWAVTPGGYPSLISILDDESSLLPFGGGNGSSGDPYILSTCEGLSAISSSTSLLASDYILEQDLDCTDAGNSIMIGADGTPFTGHFNGGGHTITVDLSSSGPDDNYIGLFRTTYGGTIHNIRISGSIAVSTQHGTGSLVGRAHGTYIFQVTSNAILVSDYYNVGGLIGESNASVIEDAHFSGSVTGNAQVGGLIGLGESGMRISRTYSSGSVHADSYHNVVGGLIGRTAPDSTITVETSFAVGALDTPGYPIIGEDSGTTTYINTFFDSTRTGTGGYDCSNVQSGAAGVCSFINYEGNDADYFKGNSTNAPFTIDGVPAWDFTGTWQVRANGYPVLGGITYPTPLSVSIAEPVDSSTVTEWNPVVDWGESTTCEYAYDNGSYQEVVCGSDGTDITAPETSPVTLHIRASADGLETVEIAVSFSYEPSIPEEPTFDGGTGTTGDPYLISTCEQLMSIDDSSEYLGYAYYLTQSIDCSGEGAAILIGAFDAPFTGVFDGDGHAIMISVTATEENEGSYIGLFRHLADAVVRNLVLEGELTTTDNSYTGMLAGLIDNSELLDVSVNGVVNAAGDTEGHGILAGMFFDSGAEGISTNGSMNAPDAEAVGGVFGYMGCTAEIFDSNSIASVVGRMYVGGFAGRDVCEGPGSLVVDSQASGDVEGEARVGGFVGQADWVQYYHVIAEGVVSGTEVVGGLIGYYDGHEEDGILFYTSAEGDVTGVTALGGLVGVAAGGIISQSYATGTVLSYDGGGVGGLIGYADTMQVRDSYARGSVPALIEGPVGGFVGASTSSIYNRSYATGTVGVGSENVGAFVGSTDGDTFIGVFWDQDSSGSTIGCGASEGCQVQGVSTLELKDREMLQQAGWDFDAVWGLDEEVNDGYPYVFGDEDMEDSASIDGPTETIILENEYHGGGVAQGWNTDDGYWEYELPFTFHFYGQDYTTIYISSNGYLGFSDQGDMENYNFSIAQGVGSPIIAAMGNDLLTNYNEGDDIYITDEGDGMVIIRWQATDIENYNSISEFEIVLHADSTFEITYGPQTQPINDGSAVGVHSGDGYYVPSAYNGYTDFNLLNSSLWEWENTDDSSGGDDEQENEEEQQPQHSSRSIQIQKAPTDDGCKPQYAFSPRTGVRCKGYANPPAAFTSQLASGNTGTPVRTLQVLLAKLGYAPGPIDGIFGNMTKAALVRFQEAYAKEILTPIGRSKGTGVFGIYSQKVMERLVANGAVSL